MMRKAMLIAVVVLLALSAAQAQTPRFGVGVFGGLNIPIAQDDQTSGTVFGLRARVQLIPLLVVEPNFLLSKWGGPDPVEGVDLGIDGSKITGFGLDATLGGGLAGTGFKPFLLVGIGSFKIKNNDTNFDETSFGIKGGLGAAIGVTPKFAIDARAAALVMPMSDGGSKKAALFTAGVTVNL